MAVEILESMPERGIGRHFLINKNLADEYASLGNMEASRRHRTTYLNVANYVAFDEKVVPRRGCESCIYMGRLKVFCGPKGLTGEADVLYSNDGDGTFTDVTAKAGISDPDYYGFGVVFSDFDNDGWPDIYVANDSVPNFLFHNKR